MIFKKVNSKFDKKKRLQFGVFFDIIFEYYSNSFRLVVAVKNIF